MGEREARGVGADAGIIGVIMRRAGSWLMVIITKRLRPHLVTTWGLFRTLDDDR